MPFRGMLTTLVVKLRFAEFIFYWLVLFSLLAKCHVDNDHGVFAFVLSGHCWESVQWEVCPGAPILDRHICAGRVS